MKNSLLKWASHLSKGTTYGYATRKDYLIVSGFCILLSFALYYLYYFICSVLNIQEYILDKYIDISILIPFDILIIIAEISFMFMRINDIFGKRCFTTKVHIFGFIGIYYLIFEGFVGAGILETVFDIQPIINSDSWLGLFIVLLFLIILCAYPSSSKEREEMPAVEYQLPKKTIAVFIAITIANFAFFLYKAVEDQRKFDHGEVIELKPDAVAYNNMGVAYANKQDYDNAIEYYEKAIELNPDDAQAYNKLSIVEKLKENGK